VHRTQRHQCICNFLGIPEKMKNFIDGGSSIHHILIQPMSLSLILTFLFCIQPFHLEEMNCKNDIFRVTDHFILLVLIALGIHAGEDLLHSDCVMMQPILI
jgi:hypothetical protein